MSASRLIFPPNNPAASYSLIVHENEVPLKIRALICDDEVEADLFRTSRTLSMLHGPYQYPSEGMTDPRSRL